MAGRTSRRLPRRARTRDTPPVRTPSEPRSVLGPAAARLAAALCAVVVAVLVAAPAAAHGQLVYEGTVPVEGARITEPLADVRLVFSETPSPVAYFTLTAPDGDRVEAGWSSGQPFTLDEPVQELNLVDGVWEPVFYPTGFPVQLSVAHWPSTGRYTVEYASVASDGEAVEGTYTFDYDGPVTPAPAGWVPPTEGRDPQLVAQLEAAENPDESSAGESLPRGQDQGEVAADPSSTTSTVPTSSLVGGPGVQPGVYVVVVIGLLVVVGSVVLVARRGQAPEQRRAAAQGGARSGNPAVRADARR